MLCNLVANILIYAYNTQKQMLNIKNHIKKIKVANRM